MSQQNDDIDDNEEEAESDISENESGMETDEDVDEAGDISHGPRICVLRDETYVMPVISNAFVQEPAHLNRPAVTARPVDYFEYFTEDEENDTNLIDILVSEKNRYATQTIQTNQQPLSTHSRMHRWLPNDRAEMRAFVGLMMTMGMIKKPTIESYWKKSGNNYLHHSPSFSQIFSRNRFQNILRFLHCHDCNDNRTAFPRGSPGKQTGVRRAVHGLGYTVVTYLSSKHRGQNHNVVLDNAFTSPTLCWDLFTPNIYNTGTVRTPRRGMPRSFKTTRVAKGERIARQQGPIMAMKYGDRKEVTFLSTFEGPSLKRTENSRGVERHVPKVVDIYNRKMGSVDLADQHIQVYDPDFRSVKLWKKLFINMILRVIGNAYVLYQRNRRLLHKMTRMEFHSQIYHQLIGDLRVDRNIPRGPCNGSRRLTERKFIENLPGKSRRPCHVCSRQTLCGRNEKRSQVRTWCPECNVGLCLGYCFRIYHKCQSFATHRRSIHED
ncbi:unnamed protein product [Mytilus coruscus]|uniref:C2H2-type domain-containing protein n=1 Tax=Mytilus coruscus TaxID=42192 RepID=A0A6J8ACE3_MYTCO|nr:unnamed protein product [Mytilus coruscus]